MRGPASASIWMLGGGSWGRAVSGLLTRRGHRVRIVHHTDRGWPAGGDPDAVVIGVPTQHVRETLQAFSAPGAPVLSLCKGIEVGTGRRVSEIVRDVWRNENVAALSGPTFAVEAEQGLPMACVLACENEGLAQQFQDWIHQPAFRVYRSTDLAGVEYGGSLKNVYAIAGGICFGLGLGDSCFASLLTRSLAEMIRLGTKLGGRPETFAGLSGVGDLLLTAHSEKSRNHRVGRLLAQGLSLEETLPRLGGVAEGVPTALSLHRMGALEGVEHPVAEQIYEVLYQGKPLNEAIRWLLEREAKPE